MDDYFGIGYNNAVEIPKSDTTTLYNRQGWAFSPEFLYQIRDNLYGGIMFDFNFTDAVETNPVMEEDPTFVEFGPGIMLQATYISQILFRVKYQRCYVPMDIGLNWTTTEDSGQICS